MAISVMANDIAACLLAKLGLPLNPYKVGGDLLENKKVVFNLCPSLHTKFPSLSIPTTGTL